MAVVDNHVHIYPDKIAQKATDSVGDFYHIRMAAHEGSIERLLELREGTPITHCVVCSVAVKPATVASINDFIASACADNGSFIGLAAMHQDFEDMEGELDRALSLGLRGVKIHPDTQAVDMDDPRLMRLYGLCEERGLAVLMHCGDYRYDYSHPRRIVGILHAFPRLRFCAAHFGGWSMPDLALEYLEHENCFLDMSSSMDYLGPRRTRELCEIYGPERMMFGSDFPMWTPGDEYGRFRELGFSEADCERICWHNAEEWLGVEIGR